MTSTTLKTLAPASSRVLSAYEKDDRETELQIAAFKRLINEERRAALAIAGDAGGGP